MPDPVALAERSIRLEELVLTLASVQAELEELSDGELDAVLSPSADGPVLLPAAHGALLRQEQEFRALVEHSPDPVTRFDPDGRIVYANPAMEALLGEPLERLRGCTLAEASGAWQGLDAWSDAVVEVAGGGSAEDREFVLLDPAGGEHAYASRFHRETGAGGGQDSVLVVSRDTSARRRAEQEVLRSREFLHASMDALSAHLAVVDADGRIVAVNRAWRRFAQENGATGDGLGVSYVEVCDAVVGPDAAVAQRTAAGIRNVLAGHSELFGLEYCCATPTQELWFQLRVTPLLSRGLRHAVVAHENSTAEHAANHAAGVERDRAVRILESVSDACFIVDAGWRFRYLNPQAEPLMGRPRGDLLGRVLWDEFPEIVGSPFERAYRQVAETGRTQAFEAYVPSMDAWHEVRAFPNDDGVAVYFCDITARRTRDREAAELNERLTAERSLLTAVVQQLPVGVVIAEAPSGRLVMGNRKIDEIWGHGFLHSESVQEYGEWEGYHADGSRVQSHEWPLFRALRTGQIIPPETFEIVRADGRRGTARLNAAPVADARGDIVAGVVVVADITDEAAAARALQASDERYRLLFRATNDVVWDRDLVRGSMQWNESLTRVLRHPLARRTCSARWWAARLHPDDRAGVEARLAAMLAGTGLSWSVEYRFERGDGTYARILDRAYLLRDDDGRAVRMIGSMLDLTERDRVEDAVRLSALLLDTMQQAVVATDLAGVVTAWNPYAEQLYGWRADEVLGRTRASVLAVGAGSEAAEAGAALALARGESWSGEMTLPHRDGRLLTVVATHSPVLSAAGRAIGEVRVSSDVTEQRSLQEQLRQAQKMEAVGMLAGGVAHDFNNMLTVIIGNVDLLLADIGAGDPRGEDLRQIGQAADRAAGLTRQLLAFSRRQILKPQNLHLGALVAGMRPMLARLLGEDIDLHVRDAEGTGSVEADPGQLEQVLMNLAVNARDAMPEGGRISIQTAEVEFDGSQMSWDGARMPAGTYAMLAVSDTGSGIPPALQARIFEPFFTTKEVGRGTGLGLSTVYGIVRQSGGFLWVYSEPGAGTVFKVYLPVVREARGAAGAEPERADLARGSETVLLVEDEASVRMLARRTLARAGYTVLECADGAHAFETAQRHGDRIALVLMDVVMPNVSGHAAAQRLKEILPHVPVIFMSGYTDDEMLRRGVLTSAALFLQKPFTPWAMLEMVRTTLDACPARLQGP